MQYTTGACLGIVLSQRQQDIEQFHSLSCCHAMATEAKTNPVRMIGPYRTPVLTKTTGAMCSACQDRITGNDKARVGAVCPKCAYVTCGKCTPGPAHQRFCARLAFAATPDLLKRAFADPPPPGPNDNEIHLDDEMKLPFQLLNYKKDLVQFNTEAERVSYFERLRTPATFEGLLQAPVYRLVPGQAEPVLDKKYTEGTAAMSYRPVITSDSLGGSNCDYLFSALALMAQPGFDTLSQLGVFLAYLGTCLTLRAVAHTTLDSRSREYYAPEAILLHTGPFIEISPYIADEKRHDVEYRGFPWETGYRFRERLDIELVEVHQKHNRQLMNVAFYVHLFHTSPDEADQWTSQGKYARQVDPKKPAAAAAPARQRPRLASTDLVLRIMGDPANPEFAVFRSAAGLYSLDDWAKGALHPPAVARQADPNKGGRTRDFNAGLGFPPKGVDHETWHASLLLHWVEPQPRYAGAGVRALSGKEELGRFADCIDALVNPEGTPATRRAAYQNLTGIKWPAELELFPFLLTFARADLTL
jgi:hypothetical protein